jgi:hypothetical protein
MRCRFGRNTEEPKNRGKSRLPMGNFCLIWTAVPREEGRLRHQESFGGAHLSAAAGVVAHTDIWLVSDHPGRFASTPPHEEGNNA